MVALVEGFLGRRYGGVGRILTVRNFEDFVGGVEACRERALNGQASEPTPCTRKILPGIGNPIVRVAARGGLLVFGGGERRNDELRRLRAYTRETRRHPDARKDEEDG
ncbi:hypothetical protein KM043_005060 [Ampulex compressa]|nr:hypothetical protein KM043_005060 [Ampulex compressa]